ncbi:MAG: hypothetical protein WAQ98_12600 [Blastocatellia bacterium]
MTEKNVEKGTYKDNNLVQSEVLDDEFIKVLKRASRPRLPRKSPDWVKKNVISNYKKQHKYLILWYNVKVKFTEYKEALFSSGQGLEIALASTLILFILGGIAYYQYTKPRTDSTKTIVNKQTPKLNVLPSPTITPIITLNPKEEIPSDIDVTKNNSNKDKIAKDPRIEKGNDKKSSIVKNTMQNFEKKENLKENLPKSYEKEEIAKNEFPKFTEPSEFHTSLNRAITLEDINSIYLGDLPKDMWSENLKIELEIELQKNWKTKETAKEASVGFKFREGQGLTLLDRNTNEIVWQKLDFAIGKGEPKIVAKEIISELVNLVNKKEPK